MRSLACGRGQRRLSTGLPLPGPRSTESAYRFFEFHHAEGEGDTDMSVEANKALVRRTYEEGVNHADLTLLDALFAPNYVNHNSSLPCDLEGLEAFKNYLQIARLDVFSELRTTIEDIFGEGDRVMVRHTWH